MWGCKNTFVGRLSRFLRAAEVLVISQKFAYELDTKLNKTKIKGFLLIAVIMLGLWLIVYGFNGVIKKSIWSCGPFTGCDFETGSEAQATGFLVIFLGLFLVVSVLYRIVRAYVLGKKT
jgi:hypothetical protein